MHRILHIGLGLYISAGWLFMLYVGGTLGPEDLFIPLFLLVGVKFPDMDIHPILEHRKTLHSLSAVFLAGAAAWAVSERYLPDLSPYPYLFPAGMILHILQDMATPSGCALLYPFHSGKFRIMKTGGTSVLAFAYTFILGTVVLFVIGGINGVIP